MKLMTDFDKPRTQKYTDEYYRLSNQLSTLAKKIKRADGTEREYLLKERKALRAILLKTPCKSQTDKKIKYVRYADDFLIGVNGSTEDCQYIKRLLSEYIHNTLKMELSEEKTLITHSNTPARFLGYDVRIRRDGKIKHGSTTNCTKRTLNNMVELNIPLNDKIMKFLFDKKVIEQKNGEIRWIHRKALLRCTELEIISTYNAELRGICNFYSMASNYCKLGYFAYLMEYSCLKTLCAKHKCSTAKIITKYKDGKGKWGIPYETKQGSKRRYFADYTDCKKSKNLDDNICNYAYIFQSRMTTFESRLNAKTCELCGTTEAGHYEIHHVHKVKDLKGKEPWERVMIAKRRKTIVLCKNCHYEIHGRVLPD